MKAIKNECKTNEKFQFKLANRSRMPNRRDFNNFSTDYKRDKFCSRDLQSMFKTLKILIEKFIALSEFSAEENNDQLILVIITPLMNRVVCQVVSFLKFYVKLVDIFFVLFFYLHKF